MDPKLKTSRTLSLIITALSFLACVGGLLVPNLYRDVPLYRLVWIGNDLVTLFLALPVLIASLIHAKHGSTKAQLYWMGALAYLLYNYAFYLLGAAFNALFLLYAALLVLCMYALIFALPRLDTAAIKNSFGEGTSSKWASGFMWLVAVSLALAEGSMIIGALAAGKVPAAPTLIFALDFWMVIPAMALGALWLWQKKAWGYILAPVMLIKGGMYTLVLCVISALTYKIQYDALTPLWAFYTVGSAVSLWLLMRTMRHAPPQAS